MNYKEIIENVVNNGQAKQATRYDNNNQIIPVENGTIGTFCEIFRHDMSKGFPLTTLRKMPWKSVRVELEGFIKGITTKKWYQDRGCKFWNEWSNPEEYNKHKLIQEFSYDEAQPKEDLDREYKAREKQAKLETDDLGPIYGYEWRTFNKTYEGQSEDDGDFSSYTDQLSLIVDKLHNSPYDRRMVCSAWNPNQMHMMALPPCHVLHNVVVYGNKLNLTWFQRSCDASHGVPTNICSYALLLLLYCEEGGLEPGELVGILSDCHLYENTIDAAKELISRDEKELPKVTIKRKEDGSFSIFDWTFDEVELVEYDPHPPIDMGKVTV